MHYNLYVYVIIKDISIYLEKWWLTSDLGRRRSPAEVASPPFAGTTPLFLPRIASIQLLSVGVILEAGHGEMGGTVMKAIGSGQTACQQVPTTNGYG